MNNINNKKKSLLNSKMIRNVKQALEWNILINNNSLGKKVKTVDKPVKIAIKLKLEGEVQSQGLQSKPNNNKTWTNISI